MNSLKLLIALIFIAPSLSISQNLPIDPETKLVSYNGIVDVAGANQKELYKRAMKWFRTNYKNPADVIKEQDSTTTYTISGIHRFKITKDVPGKKKDDPVIKNDAGLVSYSIKVSAKDNKFRYEITKINWKQQSYYPIEKWMDKTSGYYDPAFESYLQQTDTYMKELVSSLTTAMRTGDKAKSQDW